MSKAFGAEFQRKSEQMLRLWKKFKRIRRNCKARNSIQAFRMD